jgi:AAA domain/NrS-1  polymerase HBD domain
MKIPERDGELKAFYREHLADTPRERAPSTNGHGSKLSDDEVIKRLTHESTDKGSRLFEGDTSGYESHSEADLALCQKVAFYTQDPAQIERVWRASKLWRDKGDSHRDYADKTIELAIDRTPESYQDTLIKKQKAQSRSRSLGRSGLRDSTESTLNRSIEVFSFRGREKPGPRESIVEGILWRGHAGSWYGAGGIAKSLLALHLALTIADPAQRYWFGFKVVNAPVLYMDFELDADEHHRRALELCAGEGRELPEDFYYMNASELSAEEAFSKAREFCEDKGVGLVIVDSVGFALEGDSEAARDVLTFFKLFINPLKATGVTPLLIDHQAKIIKGEKYSDKEAFGSVYKGNSIRSAFQLRGGVEANEITATFTHKKANFGPKLEDFTLVITFEGEKVTVTRRGEALPNPDKQPTNQERVEEAFRELGRATWKDVAGHTGMPEKSVKNAITALKKEDKLTDTGEKKREGALYESRSPNLPRDRDRDSEVGPISRSEVPLSADLKPGESATLEELRKRRESAAGKEDLTPEDDPRPFECPATPEGNGWVAVDLGAEMRKLENEPPAIRSIGEAYSCIGSMLFLDTREEWNPNP